MTDPITFPSSTTRLALPLLYAGQAQKEVTVNEALSLADFLVHGAFESELATPPSTPAVGQMWLVGSSPQGAWTGHAGYLAGWSDGGWRFVAPKPGMHIFDRSTATFRLYDGQWRAFQKPSAPQGGTVIDVQARTTIASLIAVLSAAGLFA